MIHSIHSNLAIVKNPPPVFREGASSTHRITAFVLSILASLASFFFLPAEGAVMVSAGILSFLSLWCCSNSQGNGIMRRGTSAPTHLERRNVTVIQNVRPDFTPYPTGIIRGNTVQTIPVVQSGSRSQVAGGHQPLPISGVPTAMASARPVQLVHQQVASSPAPLGVHRAPVGHAFR